MTSAAQTHSETNLCTQEMHGCVLGCLWRSPCQCTRVVNPRVRSVRLTSKVPMRTRCLQPLVPAFDHKKEDANHTTQTKPNTHEGGSRKANTQTLIQALAHTCIYTYYPPSGTPSVHTALAVPMVEGDVGTCGCEFMMDVEG
jgi:hypothetical protein